jgi:hypothetical protein
MKKYLPFVLIILLIGCSGQLNSSDINNQPDTNTASTDYPYPNQNNNIIPSNGYPVLTPTIIPTHADAPVPPSNQFGTITGRLLVNPNDPTPELGAIVYLTAVIYDEHGVPLVAGFSRETDYKAYTDSNGRFIFTNIPYDNTKLYVIILDRVHNAFLLKNPENDEHMYFSVNPGKILDIGDLVYLDLP